MKLKIRRHVKMVICLNYYFKYRALILRVQRL